MALKRAWGGGVTLVKLLLGQKLIALQAEQGELFPGSTSATRKDSHSYAKPLHPGLAGLPLRAACEARGQGAF